MGDTIVECNMTSKVNIVRPDRTSLSLISKSDGHGKRDKKVST